MKAGDASLKGGAARLFFFARGAAGILLEQTRYWLSLTQEEITMSQKYEKPLIIPVNADRDAVGFGACNRGSSAPTGRCKVGTNAPGGHCRSGVSAGDRCGSGTVAATRCKTGGNR